MTISWSHEKLDWERIFLRDNKDILEYQEKSPKGVILNHQLYNP